MKKPTLHIIIRTCSIQKKDTTQNFDLSIRAFEFNDKEIMITECLNSLFRSCKKVKDRIRITIVDDSGTPVFREYLKILIKEYGFKGRGVIPIEKKSNKGSINSCLDILSMSDEELFFLCEDDYLFTENAIPFILDTYDEKIIGTDQFCIFPCDYPYPYEKLYPSYIFLDDNSHWRSIKQTTGTFVIPKKIFDENKDIIYKFGRTAVDFHLMELWEKIPMISPIPALATHLNYDTMSPLVNWASLLNYNYNINSHPKEKFNKDNSLKKIKRAIKWYYKNVLHKPFLIQDENNHLKAYEKFKRKK